MHGRSPARDHLVVGEAGARTADGTTAPGDAATRPRPTGAARTWRRSAALVILPLAFAGLAGCSDPPAPASTSVAALQALEADAAATTGAAAPAPAPNTGTTTAAPRKRPTAAERAVAQRAAAKRRAAALRAARSLAARQRAAVIRKAKARAEARRKAAAAAAAAAKRRAAARRPAPRTPRPVTAPPAPQSGTLSAAEAEVLRLVNAERAEAGCRALVSNGTLHRVAAAHSKDMAVRGYFSHTSQDGRSPFDRMRRAGYDGRMMGENIAAGQTSAAAVMDAWMNSPGHRANILNCGYREIGVGLYRGGSMRFYWTQNFGSR